LEAAYREAIDCTHKQGAKFFELEATTAFARWLNANGRAAEARTILTNAYDLFTEGFDTPALRDAKTLLGEMAVPKKHVRRRA